MIRSHTALDAHGCAAGSAQLHRHKAFRGVCPARLSIAPPVPDRYHPGAEHSWNHLYKLTGSIKTLIFHAIFAFSFVELPKRDLKLIKTFTIAHLVLLAILVYRKDFFSCHHMHHFFANVARISPGYNMQFIGCLRRKYVALLGFLE